MLRDNGSDSHDSYWCYGGACWPPSAGPGDRGKERSTAHRHCMFGVLVLLSSQQGHSCIWNRLQKSEHIFNMGVNVMRPVFNLESKYRVTMLTRAEWTKGHGTTLAVKGSSGLQIGHGLQRGRGCVLSAVCIQKAQYIYLYIFIY
jgi:hypothetical protein